MIGRKRKPPQVGGQNPPLWSNVSVFLSVHSALLPFPQPGWYHPRAWMGRRPVSGGCRGGLPPLFGLFSYGNEGIGWRRGSGTPLPPPGRGGPRPLSAHPLHTSLTPLRAQPPECVHPQIPGNRCFFEPWIVWCPLMISTFACAYPLPVSNPHPPGGGGPHPPPPRQGQANPPLTTQIPNRAQGLISAPPRILRNYGPKNRATPPPKSRHL